MAHFPTSNEIQLWYHYEEIAMHFNGLLMQYRLGLIGGAGALASFGAVFGGRITNPKDRNWIRVVVSFALAMIFASAAYLDVFYYNKLLQGAVKAIVEFEPQHGIKMSTTIKDIAGGGEDAIAHVYEVVLGLLTVLFIGSLVYWCLNRNDKEVESGGPNSLKGS